MITIGIDVSKLSLDIFIKDSNKSKKIKNEYETIIEMMNKMWECRVFYEATGVYSQTLCKALNDLKIEQYQLHPTNVHLLAKWLWERNKNDKIDAQRIAEIGGILYESWIDKLIQPNGNNVNLIQSDLSRIFSLKQMRVKLLQKIDKEKNDPYTNELMMDFYKSEVIKHDEMIKIIYKQIKALLEKEWLEGKLKNLESVPWINENVGMDLIGFFLKLKEKWIKKDEIAKVKAYSWLDCSQQQSWTCLNKAGISKRWNSKIRKSLYMASVGRYQMIKYNKYIETQLWKFFLRMREKFESKASKRWKSVMCAMGKKLLVTSWAIFWNDTKYNYC